MLRLRAGGVCGLARPPHSASNSSAATARIPVKARLIASRDSMTGGPAGPRRSSRTRRRITHLGVDRGHRLRNKKPSDPARAPSIASNMLTPRRRSALFGPAKVASSEDEEQACAQQDGGQQAHRILLPERIAGHRSNLIRRASPAAAATPPVGTPLGRFCSRPIGTCDAAAPGTDPSVVPWAVQNGRLIALSGPHN